MYRSWLPSFKSSILLPKLSENLSSCQHKQQFWYTLFGMKKQFVLLFIIFILSAPVYSLDVFVQGSMLGYSNPALESDEVSFLLLPRLGLGLAFELMPQGSITTSLDLAYFDFSLNGDARPLPASSIKADAAKTLHILWNSAFRYQLDFIPMIPAAVDGGLGFQLRFPLQVYGAGTSSEYYSAFYSGVRLLYLHYGFSFGLPLPLSFMPELYFKNSIPLAGLLEGGYPFLQDWLFELGVRFYL
jgi:hypothetical protein